MGGSRGKVQISKDSLSDVQRVVESRYGTISGDARMRLRDLG